MGEDRTCIPVDDARSSPFEEIDPKPAHEEGASAKTDGFIAVIESGAFSREHVWRSIQSALSLPVITYSTVSELEGQLGHTAPSLVVLSFTQSTEASVSALKVLLELVPAVPVIVLAFANDMDLAWTALRLGAKGFIPVTMGFETAIEAVRFVVGDRCKPVYGQRLP
jgi:DNA-binding NarL/FixJ family response regulator